MPMAMYLSSCEDIFLGCSLLLLATSEAACLRRIRFDRGLSMVEAESPETSDGVRVLAGGTSSFGNREE